MAEETGLDSGLGQRGSFGAAPGPCPFCPGRWNGWPAVTGPSLVITEQAGRLSAPNFGPLHRQSRRGFGSVADRIGLPHATP